MNLIECTGLRRSGNHAIIFWMLQNLSGKKEIITIEDQFIYRSGDCIFLNNFCAQSNNLISACEKLCENYLNLIMTNLNIDNIKWLIVSYEDCNINYSYDFKFDFEKRYKFSIVREIQNTFASRLKRIDLIKNLTFTSNPSMFCHNNLFYIYDNIFNDYVSLINYKNQIVFEKWLVDKDYRDFICKNINVTNLDITDYVSTIGGGSSFTYKNLDATKNLLNRKSIHSIPIKYINKMKEYKLI